MWWYYHHEMGIIITLLEPLFGFLLSVIVQLAVDKIYICAKILFKYNSITILTWRLSTYILIVEMNFIINIFGKWLQHQWENFMSQIFWLIPTVKICTYSFLCFYLAEMLMMTQAWNMRPWSIVANRTLNPAQLEWFHYWWSYSSSTDMGWTVELISAPSCWRSRWWWRFSGL